MIDLFCFEFYEQAEIIDINDDRGVLVATHQS